jgi:hypothetical protein
MVFLSLLIFAHNLIAILNRLVSSVYTASTSPLPYSVFLSLYSTVFRYSLYFNNLAHHSNAMAFRLLGSLVVTQNQEFLSLSILFQGLDDLNLTHEFMTSWFFYLLVVLMDVSIIKYSVFLSFRGFAYTHSFRQLTCFFYPFLSNVL